MRHLATPVSAPFTAQRRSLTAMHGHGLASKPPHRTLKAKKKKKQDDGCGGLLTSCDKVALRHKSVIPDQCPGGALEAKQVRV